MSRQVENGEIDPRTVPVFQKDIRKWSVFGRRVSETPWQVSGKLEGLIFFAQSG